MNDLGAACPEANCSDIAHVMRILTLWKVGITDINPHTTKNDFLSVYLLFGLSQALICLKIALAYYLAPAPAPGRQKKNLVLWSSCVGINMSGSDGIQ